MTLTMVDNLGLVTYGIFLHLLPGYCIENRRSDGDTDADLLTKLRGVWDSLGRLFEC